MNNFIPGMRVCVIDPSLFTLPYDQQLCAGLHAAGAEVTLCGRRLRREERMQPHAYAFEPRCYQWTEDGGKPSRSRWRAWSKAVEHVWTAARLTAWARERFDVLHFQWSPLPLIDAWHWRRLARERTVIFTVHDTTPFLDRPTSRAQKLGWRKLLDVAHGLIVHTQASRRDLVRLGVPDERISVIPHGPLLPVSEEVAHIVSPAPDDADREHRLLVFGEIKPYKGTDVLLQALARLPREVTRGWRLVIAGRPRCDVQPLRALAETVPLPVEWRLDYVPADDVPRLFREAELAVFPYRRVDASGALMLALPLGVPVVATRVGVFAEMLTDGETAVLAAPDDVDSLAQALQRAMTDATLREAMRKNIRGHMQGVWSWPMIARAHLEAYERHSPFLPVGKPRPADGWAGANSVGEAHVVAPMPR